MTLRWILVSYRLGGVLTVPVSCESGGYCSRCHLATTTGSRIVSRVDDMGYHWGFDRWSWGGVELRGRVVFPKVWTVTAESGATLSRDINKTTVAWQRWVGWAPVGEKKPIHEDYCNIQCSNISWEHCICRSKSEIPSLVLLGCTFVETSGFILTVTDIFTAIIPWLSLVVYIALVNTST